MDNLNRQILDILQVEGRISMTELGKKISLSVPAVTERVRKLEDQGVIEGLKLKLTQIRYTNQLKHLY